MHLLDIHIYIQYIHLHFICILCTYNKFVYIHVYTVSWHRPQGGVQPGQGASLFQGNHLHTHIHTYGQFSEQPVNLICMHLLLLDLTWIDMQISLWCHLEAKTSSDFLNRYWLYSPQRWIDECLYWMFGWMFDLINIWLCRLERDMSVL